MFQLPVRGQNGSRKRDRQGSGDDQLLDAFCCVLDSPTVIDVEIVRHAGDHGGAAARVQEVVKRPRGDNESGRHGKACRRHPAQAGALAPGNRRGLCRQVAESDDCFSRGFQQDRTLRSAARADLF